MTSVIHSPPEYAEPIYRWYRRAQIDYTEYYIRMYVAYNTWYREVTGSTNDRQSLALLKKRVIIWDDYVNNRTMRPLRTYMERLVELTQKAPLARTLHWSGYLENSDDWRSLIEFWYQVRCLLVHGSNVQPKFVWLAYETLDIFMGELISRMNQALKEQLAPIDAVEASSKLIDHSSKYAHLREKLYAQYFTSPNLWQVDMQRVNGE